MKPIRGGLLLAAGVIAALIVISATAWAAYPGANGRIVYSAGVESGGEIFTISPAGGHPTQLTDNAISDIEPSWSADGRRLAFIRGEIYTGPTHVWTMRADGTRQRQVTHGRAYESSPSFSPGGGRIVLARNGKIVTVRTDGTERVRLTSGNAASPVFSPDGRRIAFNGEARKRSAVGIWVMHRDGTHKRLLADQEDDVSGGAYYYHPDFDPDGSHLVFARCIDDGHTCDTDNMLMRSNGRRKRVIEGGDAPVFSPTGNRIAAVQVSCNLDENCHETLISFNRHGSDRRTVRDHQREVLDSIGGPSWQPIPTP